jgi:hypothetical protein
MNFCFNTVVAPGALTIDSGTMPTVCGNYFEEVQHQLTIGGFINIAGAVGTVTGAQIYNNYVNVDVSTTAAAGDLQQ